MVFHYPDHGLAMDAAAASSSNPSFSPGAGGREREKEAVAVHPLYERLLEAHIAYLRVATPVDQLPRIDAQMADRRPPASARRRRQNFRAAVELARQVFDRMPARDLASWNVMILTLANHGCVQESVEMFDRITCVHKVVPNAITFVAVLSACNHGGLVEEGRRYFESSR